MQDDTDGNSDPWFGTQSGVVLTTCFVSEV